MAEQEGQPETNPILDRSEGRLEVERQESLAWISERWTEDRKCPICGTQDWLFGDTASLPIYASPGKVYPLMPVVCKTCAFTRFFHAGYMGIIPPSEDQA